MSCSPTWQLGALNPDPVTTRYAASTAQVLGTTSKSIISGAVTAGDVDQIPGGVQ
jgi:hypothetical protein